MSANKLEVVNNLAQEVEQVVEPEAADIRAPGRPDVVGALLGTAGMLEPNPDSVRHILDSKPAYVCLLVV